MGCAVAALAAGAGAPDAIGDAGAGGRAGAPQVVAASRVPAPRGPVGARRFAWNADPRSPCAHARGRGLPHLVGTGAGVPAHGGVTALQDRELGAGARAWHRNVARGPELAARFRVGRGAFAIGLGVPDALPARARAAARDAEPRLGVARLRKLPAVRLVLEAPRVPERSGLFVLPHMPRGRDHQSQQGQAGAGPRRTRCEQDAVGPGRREPFGLRFGLGLRRALLGRRAGLGPRLQHHDRLGVGDHAHLSVRGRRRAGAEGRYRRRVQARLGGAVWPPGVLPGAARASGRPAGLAPSAGGVCARGRAGGLAGIARHGGSVPSLGGGWLWLDAPRDRGLSALRMDLETLGVLAGRSVFVLPLVLRGGA
mmetsp:Transcript_44471/g.134811  ORF Transcript_44471/g.134811 Transcript_44471/m.134811 type:complete len:368 (-) Transcript_44471:525-1628(-)